MSNNKFVIMISIILCIMFPFTACSTNDPLSLEENSQNTKKSNPQKKESNSSQQKTTPPPAPKAANPPPAPKPSPKKGTGSKKTQKKQAPNNVISSFSTKIIDYDENRVSNIRLAAKQVNNYVLNPGETFSFNKVVGSRDPGKGYKEATVLVKGEREAGVGGGVCQLSSTIYNAAVRSGFTIVERHTHSNDVHYVPRGRDAAVNYGDKDLKFTNTKDYPVKLRIIVGNGRVSVSIVKATQ